MTQRLGWVDTTSGVSGDMLLGALVGLRAVDVADVVRRLGVDADVAVTSVVRHGLTATTVRVATAPDQPHRRLSDLIAILDAADLGTTARDRAADVFRRLAAAEARVHDVDPEAVEFHEVGAVDTLVDVVGVCTGLEALQINRLVTAPIALGGGQARSGHGVLPVPGPAVLELLRDSALVAAGGPVDVELATPTGVALLTEWADESGPMPPMSVSAVGVGAGTREIDEIPNVLRLVVGEAAADGNGWQVLECNVDDLDPRVWPLVLDRVLAAGAADAWLTPILMKKGRPAHTLSVLVAEEAAAAVIDVVFAETSTIGARSTRVDKHALDRRWVEVDVAGQSVRVKVAAAAGAVVNISPEFDDVVRAATALDRPVKDVLASAAAAAHAALEASGS